MFMFRQITGVLLHYMICTLAGFILRRERLRAELELQISNPTPAPERVRRVMTTFPRLIQCETLHRGFKRLEGKDSLLLDKKI